MPLPEGEMTGVIWAVNPSCARLPSEHSVYHATSHYLWL
jgi:hypothetical protein